MICKRCGSKFSDGMFCPECGASIGPVSGLGANEHANTLETALEYTEGAGYNTRMYGPQGLLEEEQITTAIKIDVGGKKVFENKKLNFKNYIESNNNTTLEFRNCELISDREVFDRISAIIESGQSNVCIKFENCVIKVAGQLVYMSSAYSKNDIGVIVEFRNCAFVGGEDMADSFLLAMHGRVYFENCFIKERSIGRIRKGLVESELELRNCVIINESEDVKEYLISSWDNEVKVVINLENCFIRSKKRLAKKFAYGSKLLIKNCFIDNYFIDLNI